MNTYTTTGEKDRDLKIRSYHLDSYPNWTVWSNWVECSSLTSLVVWSNGKEFVLNDGIELSNVWELCCLVFQGSFAVKRSRYENLKILQGNYWNSFIPICPIIK